MQIPENPSNNDIRDALIQLRQELGQQMKNVENKVDQLDNKVNQLDYRFDAYQKGPDGMVRMANTIIIATVLSLSWLGLVRQ